MTMTRLATLAILAASVLAPACTEQLPSSPPPANVPPPGSTSGDTGTTFDHDNNTISPWDLLDRLTIEGPPSYTSHVHSCPKVRYVTLGNVLSDLGINPTNTTNLSAGQLYTGGYAAMGGPNYAARVRENISITTSGASREFDIFAAAADEVINAFANNTLARCPGAVLFDASNACQASGLTCLLGTPATMSHIALCTETVTRASSVTQGKRLAVAVMLAAAYTCE
jgi:hypothetical protein